MDRLTERNSQELCSPIEKQAPISGCGDSLPAYPSGAHTLQITSVLRFWKTGNDRAGESGKHIPQHPQAQHSGCLGCYKRRGSGQVRAERQPGGWRPGKTTNAGDARRHFWQETDLFFPRFVVWRSSGAGQEGSPGYTLPPTGQRRSPGEAVLGLLVPHLSCTLLWSMLMRAPCPLYSKREVCPGSETPIPHPAPRTERLIARLVLIPALSSQREGPIRARGPTPSKDLSPAPARSSPPSSTDPAPKPAFPRASSTPMQFHSSPRKCRQHLH